MSALVLNQVRKGFYLDSVALMRLSREITTRTLVEDAALMMGTPANQTILEDAGLLVAEGRAAQGNDLIMAVRAETETAAQAALEAAAELIDAPRRATVGATSIRPRSLGAALAERPDSNLALISVPGDFAVAEARKALDHGLHVLLFSDNVAIEDERELKDLAATRGLLVMGADCGTAVLGGVPLAFSNQVPRGDIGMIGASGTGMQEVMSLIAQGGGGLSQAIGVGGRDLSEIVGGITTLMAIDALDRDPATRHIVLISKPPAATVAGKIVARVAKSDKPFTLCFIGIGTMDLPKNARVASTLKAAAEDALGNAEIGRGFSVARLAENRGREGRVVGLFVGGTLAAEAQIILASQGRQVASNAPVPGSQGIEGATPEMHQIFDLGADEYTQGRPHPMIDPSVRDAPLRHALSDPGTAVVLLDVVLGTGSHDDPAGHLAGVIVGYGEAGPAIVASVTGTEADPQVRSVQIAKLEEAGVLVAPSNAQAAELALALCSGAL